MVHQNKTIALPLELRVLIYELLFSSECAVTHSFLDQCADAINDGFSIAILQANKATYAEASSVLYHQKALDLDLVGVPDEQEENTIVVISDEPDDDTNDAVSDESDGDAIDVQACRSVFKADNAPFYEHSPSMPTPPVVSSNGLIYERCFRRLSKIEIFISYDSFWICGTVLRGLSVAGKTLIHALMLLASDDVAQHERGNGKSLVVRMESDLSGRFILQRNFKGATPSSDGSEVQTAEIVDLLRRIQRGREVKLMEVKIGEGFAWQHMREAETREVDLGVF